MLPTHPPTHILTPTHPSVHTSLHPPPQTPTHPHIHSQTPTHPHIRPLRQTELAEDSDEEMEVDPSTSSGPPKTPKHDLMMEEGRAKSVFFKQAKSFPMFPFREEKLKWDEYGEPIRCVWVGVCVWVWVCVWVSE